MHFTLLVIFYFESLFEIFEIFEIFLECSNFGQFIYFNWSLSYMVLFGAEASLKALEYCILRERSG